MTGEPVPPRGGMIPQSGIYDAEALGAFMGVDAETIRKYLRDYKVECIIPGATAFVDVRVFLAALPRRVFQNQRRGGRRRGAA